MNISIDDKKSRQHLKYKHILKKCRMYESWIPLKRSTESRPPPMPILGILKQYSKSYRQSNQGCWKIKKKIMDQDPEPSEFNDSSHHFRHIPTNPLICFTVMFLTYTHYLPKWWNKYIQMVMRNTASMFHCIRSDLSRTVVKILWYTFQ